MTDSTRRTFLGHAGLWLGTLTIACDGDSPNGEGGSDGSGGDGGSGGSGDGGSGGSGGEPDGPINSQVQPALTVGYVDTSGTRHWAPVAGEGVADNVTTISGTAPFFVEFYGGDTRSAPEDSTDAAGAWWNIGYLMSYGEDLGGDWSVSGRPRDSDRGFPMFAHCYTTVGTHEARLWCRDSAGNQAFIRVNIDVTAPGAGVDMTPGVLPSFTSNTVYNAPAGGTWGNINSSLNGLHNVTIRKVGRGADPVFGTVNLDNRNEPRAPITRTRGVRFLNCDVANVVSGGVGFDYCAFIGGRVRSVSFPPSMYLGDQIFASNRTETQANNLRYSRGLMLQDTGELNEPSGEAYVLIGGHRGFHMKNVVSRKTTSTEHNTRGIFAYSSFRHCRFTNDVSSVSYHKFQGGDCTLNVDLPNQKGTPDPWGDNDYVVNYAEERVLGVPSTRVAIVDCQFGEAGGQTPVANAGFSPENNDDGQPGQGCELSGYEYCIWIQTRTWYTVNFTGRHVGLRDCRLDLGAGGEIEASTAVATNRTPDGWAGPYVASGTRPVVMPE